MRASNAQVLHNVMFTNGDIESNSVLVPLPVATHLVSFAGAECRSIGLVYAPRTYFRAQIYRK